MSQADRILEYLKQGNTLTGLEALDKFDCIRLTSRVFDLKQKGHDIREKTIKTRSGKGVSQYWLMPKVGEQKEFIFDMYNPGDHIQ